MSLRQYVGFTFQKSVEYSRPTSYFLVFSFYFRVLIAWLLLGNWVKLKLNKQFDGKQISWSAGLSKIVDDSTNCIREDCFRVEIRSCFFPFGQWFGSIKLLSRKKWISKKIAASSTAWQTHERVLRLAAWRFSVQVDTHHAHLLRPGWGWWRSLRTRFTKLRFD